VVSRYIDNRIKYFKKKNEERAAARNFGIKVASGEYALFFDSDDIMYANYLQVLNQKINAFQQQPYIIAAKYEFFDDKGDRWPSVLANQPEGWYNQNLFIRANPLACNFCIKLKDNPFKLFPEERALASMEDWLFLLQNLTKSNTLYLIDKVCMAMREHEGRSMADNTTVIKARQVATNWAISNIEFDKSERDELIAYSEYFCSVHYYIDGRRKQAIQKALKAIKSGGVKLPFLLQIPKAIVGRKWISKLKLRSQVMFSY
jgi:glycosyltransferase involved in cell wall biosynthesis